MVDPGTSKKRVLACKTLVAGRSPAMTGDAQGPQIEGLQIEWRSDIQAVSFRPEGHDVFCMIHRLAIRTLAGRVLTPDGCLNFARAHAGALQAAASEKIRARNIPSDRSLHLTSRDVRRRSAIQRP